MAAVVVVGETSGEGPADCVGGVQLLELVLVVVPSGAAGADGATAVAEDGATAAVGGVGGGCVMRDDDGDCATAVGADIIGRIARRSISTGLFRHNTPHSGR